MLTAEKKYFRAFEEPLCLYVERNPLRAKLIEKAEDWPWSSLWIRERGSQEQKDLLSDWPIEIPKDYLTEINGDAEEEEEDILERIRQSVKRGSPFGNNNWSRAMASKLGLESTLNSRGRPRKGT